MYWSWRKDFDAEPISCIHQVFLGHEGSVFGVRISKELQSGCCQSLKRVITSCSDDRTIRVWDVSSVNLNTSASQDSETLSETQRTRHTGFSNVTLDAESSNLNCLAIGWGHTSRVWTIQFLDSSPCDGALFLQSTGEDATSRTWKMVFGGSDETKLPYKLIEIDCAAYHNGKNMWSATICNQSRGPQQVVCGAADSKITTYPLTKDKRNVRGNGVASFTEYTTQDVISMAQPTTNTRDTGVLEKPKKGVKADSIRSYCFLDEGSFLLTTNSGKVLLQSLQTDAARSAPSILSTSKFVGQMDDLVGYSTCTSEPLLGVAFVAGTNGGVYMLSNRNPTLKNIHTVKGKVGNMFLANISPSPDRGQVAVLVTLVGQKEAQLLLIDTTSEDSENIKVMIVPISESLTGSLITSMTCMRDDRCNVLLLGFRRGSVAIYSIDDGSSDAALVRVVDKVHGDETVTSLVCVPSQENPSSIQLLSVGRNGYLAIHWVDLLADSVELVHNLALPIGTNIEGAYYHQNSLLVHGFSSKKWILYDVTSEEEVMGVETGGAHRSWAFQPRLDTRGGGTLVWTRASSMHICSQTSPNHGVIRSGGHGREIKAVTVNSGASKGLVATGAEDTDIKLFQYVNDHIVCRRTLRRHTTGIQHLQWSEDGDYLFSSGGSEEFYVWRIRKLPSTGGIGVVCEYVYTPESEFSDLRIMSFDVSKRDAGYVIAMVFSDSSIKVSTLHCLAPCITADEIQVYHYDATAATKWRALARGVYFTSCLTQCMFLSPEKILTAGTDGHAVVWPLSTDVFSPSETAAKLSWQDPVRIHQNSAKTMVSQALDSQKTLVVSGGDDGSLAFLLASNSLPSTTPSASYASQPTLVNRAHGSAITACAVLKRGSSVFVVTSGNDEWVRLWEAIPNNASNATDSTLDGTVGGDKLEIKRLAKVKTSVADVSSIAVLDRGDEGSAARVLVCGVGMEVLRLEWSDEASTE
jgi:WD40 repeat protein